VEAELVDQPLKRSPGCRGCDADLVAQAEGVETADRVLLRLVEVEQVVLVAAAVRGTEEARALIDVLEDQAPEVAVERLAADTGRDEVVVRGQIGKVGLEGRQRDLGLRRDVQRVIVPAAPSQTLTKLFTSPTPRSICQSNGL
jgi:hypothetical protein